MRIRTELAVQWFEGRLKSTLMQGARMMFEAALTALREKAEREDPRPLTPEELRGMIGEPVYTIGVYQNGALWAGWDIIEKVDEDGLTFGYSCEIAEWWAYDLRSLNGVLLDCGWQAYRYKPKEV